MWRHLSVCCSAIVGARVAVAAAAAVGAVPAVALVSAAVAVCVAAPIGTYTTRAHEMHAPPTPLSRTPMCYCMPMPFSPDSHMHSLACN